MLPLAGSFLLVTHRILWPTYKTQDAAISDQTGHSTQCPVIINYDQPHVYPRLRFDDEAQIKDGVVQAFLHWYNNAWFLGTCYIDNNGLLVRDIGSSCAL